jgi:hypothetical protein
MKLFHLSTTLTLAACATVPEAATDAFADDVAFLQEHVQTLVLRTPDGARIAVVPAFQGRVMTSTTASGRGESFGWVNRELIATRKFADHINAFGGEDRFWLGPEGGQFSIFFAPEAKFELADWQTPAPIDSEPFTLVTNDATQATFVRTFELTNWSRTRFRLEVRREVRLCDPAAVVTKLGAELAAGVHGVSFETANTVRNAGTRAWKKETGLLSIWILGMFTASPACTVLVPFVPGPEAEHGVLVNDDYFGKVPEDRLHVDAEKGLLTFRGDAQYRSKIGLGPRRARPVLGSWDEANGVLTIVEYSLHPGRRDYVNSQWRLQDEPYSGDVVNSYNDGPLAPGVSGLGNFYELESSSPALALIPGDRWTHVQRTTHLVGPRSALAAVAARVLGADLDALPGAAQ